MAKLLLDERPLIIMPSLAVKIGLNESIFLQQLHYWLERSSHTKENKKWVYNSINKWQEQFPFWSPSTIGRIISKLEKSGFVISGKFNSLAIDNTKWYRINYEKLQELESGSTDLRNRQSSSQNDNMVMSEGVDEDIIMNRPLPEITTEITTEINNNNINNAGDKVIETPFSFYEKNGFGNLTPHVGEKIGSWIDDLNEELVIHALKMSAESGILRWKYAEAILRDWHNKKFNSLEQVFAAEKKREQETMNAGKRNSRNVREEKTPDWLNKDKQDKETNAKSEKSKEEIDAERAALIKELNGENE